ncbi:fungal-specific transcription factor domain-containing protein [Pestalotiopsis sp. NC0098]|nr:fungal-specific transcription factor domain-containing protein [Pestalotiopsis sp. NC0098]
MATAPNDAPLQPKTIRFVNNQGQPPQKRRRINAACLTCRRRKTRCAGEHPECSTCVKNGHKCLGYSDVPEKAPKRDPGPAASPEVAVIDHNDAQYSDDELPGLRRHEHWKQNRNGLGRRDTEESSTSSRRLSESTQQPSVRLKSETVDWDESQSFAQHGHGSGKLPRRPTTYARHSSFSTQDGRSPSVRSPTMHHNHAHTESYRVPYFRYFGPTAIVPGFKQMVVKVHDRRRSSMSATSPGSGVSFPSIKSIQSEHEYEQLDDVPAYDPHDSGPVHPLILELISVFFSHLGCNYPFLREEKFTRWVKEKRVEPILVDAVCALAARFSDSPILNRSNGKKTSKADNGHVFAQRAKAATVDTFPCPSVAAVQACLLMAYEGFGADQDSALWMYLGLAIRMAVDLGLHKKDGVKYQGERDAWYTRAYSRQADDHDQIASLSKPSNEDTLSFQEQRELEQERMDTLWTVFMLDRVISSGTGRPVTLRDVDFELDLLSISANPENTHPDPFPTLIQMIHLYGRVSDVLNEIVKPNDLTDERMNKLIVLENELTRLHRKQHPNLQFNAEHFQTYVQTAQGVSFILLHLWFHAMIIVLHQPALLAPLIQYDQGRELGSQSREISMSSAKTIADILAFANLIDAKSFIGNPFTSQPIYIAACAFLVESEKTHASSQPVSRAPSPHADRGSWATSRLQDRRDGPPSTRHFLLASAANQNYQACYKALQHMHTYWGGVRYILTALDQKSEGIWDCETYTREEYESARLPRRGSSLQRLMAAKAEQCASPTPQPGAPPLAWSLTGTLNTPGPSLTLLFPPNSSNATTLVPPPVQAPSQPQSAPTPPGNMIYDPIRQSIPETAQMYPPAYPQPNTSALRHSMTQAHSRQLSGTSGASDQSKPWLRYDGKPHDDAPHAPIAPDANSFQVETPSLPPACMHPQRPQTPSSHTSSGHESSNFQTGASPMSTMTDMTVTQSHGGTNVNSSNTSNGLASGTFTYLESTGQGLDLMTFDNQTDFGPALNSFETAEMASWLGNWAPSELINDVFEGSYMGQ